MNYWIFIGGPENLRHWEARRLHDGQQWFWTANKRVRSGDTGFIYLTAPLSRIIGEVDIVGEPFFNHAEGGMFSNRYMLDKWCVEVANPVYFTPPGDGCAECGKSRDGHNRTPGWYEEGACEQYQKIVSNLSMTNMRKLFAKDWGWVRYSRGNTQVPPHVLAPFLELIDQNR